MNISEQPFTLKDGRAFVLRSVQVAEAALLVEHMRQTAGESHFLSRYPDEVTMTVEREEEFLERMLEHPMNFMLGAFVEGRLAGTCSVIPVNALQKFRHRGEFGISLKKEFWGGGIGSCATAFCMEQARKNGLEFIELSVFSDNERAIALYKNFGFQPVGCIPNAYKLRDGTYRDEIIMSLDLAEDHPR